MKVYNKLRDIRGRFMPTQWDFTEEIDRGEQLLDRVAPGWVASIDTERLNLESATSCVLGQLAMADLRQQITAYRKQAKLHPVGAPYYYEAAEMLQIEETDEAAHYGFNLPDWLARNDYGQMRPGAQRAWEQLTLQWGERIDKRLAEAGLLH